MAFEFLLVFAQHLRVGDVGIRDVLQLRRIAHAVALHVLDRQQPQHGLLHLLIGEIVGDIAHRRHRTGIGTVEFATLSFEHHRDRKMDVIAVSVHVGQLLALHDHLPDGIVNLLAGDVVGIAHHPVAHRVQQHRLCVEVAEARLFDLREIGTRLLQLAGLHQMHGIVRQAVDFGAKLLPGQVIGVECGRGRGLQVLVGLDVPAFDPDAVLELAAVEAQRHLLAPADEDQLRGLSVNHARIDVLQPGNHQPALSVLVQRNDEGRRAVDQQPHVGDGHVLHLDIHHDVVRVFRCAGAESRSQHEQ